MEDLFSQKKNEILIVPHGLTSKIRPMEEASYRRLHGA